MTTTHKHAARNRTKGMISIGIVVGLVALAGAGTWWAMGTAKEVKAADSNVGNVKAWVLPRDAQPFTKLDIEHFMTKEGEPSFRWIDKDFAAERGIVTEILELRGKVVGPLGKEGGKAFTKDELLTGLGHWTDAIEPGEVGVVASPQEVEGLMGLRAGVVVALKAAKTTRATDRGQPGVDQQQVFESPTKVLVQRAKLLHIEGAPNGKDSLFHFAVPKAQHGDLLKALERKATIHALPVSQRKGAELDYIDEDETPQQAEPVERRIRINIGGIESEATVDSRQPQELGERVSRSEGDSK
ncbi:MAG: hypothetical protein ACK57N_06280 [Planctomycetia bacterium]